MLPCPFCGDVQATIFEHFKDAHYFYANCIGCDAEGPPALSFKEARDAWNRRGRSSNETTARQAIEREALQQWRDTCACGCDACVELIEALRLGHSSEKPSEHREIGDEIHCEPRHCFAAHPSLKLLCALDRDHEGSHASSRAGQIVQWSSEKAKERRDARGFPLSSHGIAIEAVCAACQTPLITTDDESFMHDCDCRHYAPNG